MQLGTAQQGMQTDFIDQSKNISILLGNPQQSM